MCIFQSVFEPFVLIYDLIYMSVQTYVLIDENGLLKPRKDLYDKVKCSTKSI